MDHVAIMTKKYKLIEAILDGRKTIESRWYVNRIAPWNRIFAGDIVYFKNSGAPVTAKAGVCKVIQYDGLNMQKIAKIYEQYGDKIGVSKDQLQSAISNKKNKCYCILAFLKSSKKIEQFNIDKTGFGSACAWLCVENIESIKK